MSLWFRNPGPSVGLPNRSLQSPFTSTDTSRPNALVLCWKVRGYSELGIAPSAICLHTKRASLSPNANTLEPDGPRHGRPFSCPIAHHLRLFVLSLSQGKIQRAVYFSKKFLSPKLRDLESNSPDSVWAQIAGMTIEGYEIRHFWQTEISKKKEVVISYVCVCVCVRLCVCVFGGGCGWVGACVCTYIPVVPLVRIYQ